MGELHSPRPGIVIADKYELVAQMAKGGMGSIWKARHRLLDADVAIKFMDVALSSEAEPRRRFEREARASAKLRSPNIVQILDYGVDREVPYLAMELLEGEDLRMLLRARRCLRLGEASDILRQICKGLQLAHDAGIVHRDLKPANIFVSRSGGDTVVKLLDFGIAKLASHEVGSNTESGILLGSPRYMSPEQAHGRDRIDHRSDLWSLAVMLFRIVTGRRLFRGKDIGDLVLQICVEPIPALTFISAVLPAELDRFFARALERERDFRFQSATELAEAFSEIAARYPHAHALDDGADVVPEPTDSSSILLAAEADMSMQGINDVGTLTRSYVSDRHSRAEKSRTPVVLGMLLLFGLLVAGGLAVFGAQESAVGPALGPSAAPSPAEAPVPPGRTSAVSRSAAPSSDPSAPAGSASAAASASPMVSASASTPVPAKPTYRPAPRPKRPRPAPKPPTTVDAPHPVLGI